MPRRDRDDAFSCGSTSSFRLPLDLLVSVDLRPKLSGLSTFKTHYWVSKNRKPTCQVDSGGGLVRTLDLWFLDRFPHDARASRQTTRTTRTLASVFILKASTIVCCVGKATNVHYRRLADRTGTRVRKKFSRKSGRNGPPPGRSTARVESKLLDIYAVAMKTPNAVVAI